MKTYKEHLDKIQYVRNSLENEILWIRKIFFNDIFVELNWRDVVEERKLPLIKIWYQELGKEIPEQLNVKKSDAAIWELNTFGNEKREVEMESVEYVSQKTKCPTEVVLEIMKAMDIVYLFCGKREYDSTDKDYVRQYCNVYMADAVYKTNELFNKLIVPINEVMEQGKKDRNMK